MRNLIREGKTHQIYSVLQTGSASGMQTMDTSLAHARARGQDHPEARRSPLATPEELAPPARRGVAGSGVGTAGRMSTYVFKAMDLAGVKARGEVEADSKQAVSDQLKSRGLIVLDISDKHGSNEIELSFLKRVKANELAIFSRQLSTMISSGMSILRSLYVLEEQTESKFLKETIVAVRKDVEAGLVAERRDGASPEGVQPAVRRDDAGRGDGRCARGRADARRRPAAEGRRAAPPDQIGDGLPDDGDHLRRRA